MTTQGNGRGEHEVLWERLCEHMLGKWPNVTRGRMMSAPALLHEGKVFVFFSARGGRAGLGCRLGREYPFETQGLIDWQHLAPFRSRPPMKDWIVAGMGDSARWEFLAEEALAIASRKKGNKS